MDWILLFVAGLFEVAWAVALKHSDGFTRLIPSILTIGAMGASMAFLGLALRTIPVGTAYVTWTGIGAVGTATYGIIGLGESATLLRVSCIGLVVLGIFGLNLFVSAK